MKEFTQGLYWPRPESRGRKGKKEKKRKEPRGIEPKVDRNAPNHDGGCPTCASLLDDLEQYRRNRLHYIKMQMYVKEFKFIIERKEEVAVNVRLYGTLASRG